jgi:hypothetical protein
MSEQSNLAGAIQEVTERAQVLVREEIELAKVEVTTKVKKLARGGVIGLAAGIFVLGALVLILFGFAFLAWWAIPFPGNTGNLQIFWGFFLVAVLLLILAAIAGLIAAKAFKAGSPPAPTMAIDEAKRIRTTITSPDDPLKPV